MNFPLRNSLSSHLLYHLSYSKHVTDSQLIVCLLVVLDAAENLSELRLPLP